MTFPEFAAQLSIALIPIIGSGIAALIGVGITYLYALIKAKFGEQAAAKAAVYLRTIQDAVDGAVISVQQSTVDRLKASNQWNEYTAKKVKADALQLALESLGGLRSKIEAQLLLDLPVYMGSLVEVSLRNLKQQTPAPAPAPEPKPVDPTPTPAPAPVPIVAPEQPVPAPETPPVTPAPAPVDPPAAVQG